MTSRSFSGLAAGSRYYFRVRAYNTSGQQSQPSSEVSYLVPGTPSSTAPTISAVSPTSGPLAGGTVLTITGTNFVSGATVRVGTLSATTTFVSATQLRATTPAGAATGATSVTVTNPGGLAATRSNAFTYVSSTASPSFDSASPTSGPLAGGTVVTIMGANFASGATVRFGSRSATTTFVSSTQLRATTPAAAATGAVSITVTNPNGLTASRGSAFTYTGTSSGGSPTFNSVSPTSGPLAGGTTITVTGTNFVSGATVKVGGRAATSVTFISSTQVRARTPAGAAVGSTSVAVTNPNGQSASRGSAFYYYVSSSSATTLTSTESATSETMLASAASVDVDGAADVAAEASVDADAATVDAAATMSALAPEAAAKDTPATTDATVYRSVLATWGVDGAQTRLALANADNTDAAAVLVFTDTTGQVTRVPVTVPARQRRTVDLSTVAALRGATFSIELQSDRPVALDRLTTLGRDGDDASLSTATEPATKWYFADGSTSQPFELWYSVRNTGSVAADLEIRYLLPGGAAPIVKRHAVAAGALETIRVDLEDAALADTDVAAEIVSLNDTPIVVERSQYLVEGARSEARGGDTSNGVASPAASWWVQGSTGRQALFLLIANPGGDAAVADVTYVRADGQRVSRRYDVSAGGRTTIDVAHEDPALANASLGIHVASTTGAPLVVERAAWWGADGAWTDGLTGGGVSEPAARWLLAEGEEGGARKASTSLSIVNAASHETEVRVTLLFEGAGEVSSTFTLKGSTTLAVPIAKTFPRAAGRRFAVLVESVAGTPDLVVTRDLFWPSADGEVAGASSPAVALPSR